MDFGGRRKGGINSLTLTTTEEALQRVPEDDLRRMCDMLQEGADEPGPFQSDWARLLRRVKAELGRRYGADSVPPALRLVQDQD